MRTHWPAAFVFLLALVAVNASAGELLMTAGVLNIFADVLRRGEFGLRDVETAAFVVRDEDGGYRCELWPPTNQFRAAKFTWNPPPNVVAIVHTHPASMPKSSNGDRETAIRLAIPVYSLTLANIYVVDSLGVSKPLVRNRHWFVDKDWRSGMCALIRPTDLLPPKPPATTISAQGCADTSGFQSPETTVCMP
jgi:hypothetical protein